MLIDEFNNELIYIDKLNTYFILNFIFSMFPLFSSTFKSSSIQKIHENQESIKLKYTVIFVYISSH